MDDESNDLLVNDLVYVSPEPLSLAVNRTQNRQFFQRSVYTQQETARIDLNSGTEYCDPANSYLTFNVLLTGTTNSFSANFGTGSAMNLIRQVTIRSKSGTEIDRVENANIFSRIKTLNTESMAYLETTGSIEGWSIENLKNIGGIQYLLEGVNAQTYAIPLKRLSGFFEPIKQGQLLPAAIMSGLTIEIIFEDVRTAVVRNPAQTTATCTGYTISNISIVLDSVALTDDTQKTLNSISASSGLEITYPRVYTSINDMNGSSANLSAQVRKAVSNTSYAVAVSLNPAYIRNINEDSFASAYLADTVQWRIGSLYFPNQPLKDPTGVESFYNTKMVFNKLKNEHQESAVSYTMYSQTCGSLCASFEKNQLLQLSGIPCNNSRCLELECLFSSANTRQVYVFLVYNAVSRSYLDNTSVAI